MSASMQSGGANETDRLDRPTVWKVDPNRSRIRAERASLLEMCLRLRRGRSVCKKPIPAHGKHKILRLYKETQMIDELLYNAKQIVKELRAENDALRAELAAAKTELADAHYILDQLGAPRDDEHDEPLEAMDRVYELIPSHIRAEAAEADRDALRAALVKAGEALEKSRVFTNGEFLRRAAGDDESYDEDEQAIPLLSVLDAALIEIRKLTGENDDD